MATHVRPFDRNISYCKILGLTIYLCCCSSYKTYGISNIIVSIYKCEIRLDFLHPLQFNVLRVMKRDKCYFCTNDNIVSTDFLFYTNIKL